MLLQTSRNKPTRKFARPKLMPDEVVDARNATVRIIVNHTFIIITVKMLEGMNDMCK